MVNEKVRYVGIKRKYFDGQYLPKVKRQRIDSNSNQQCSAMDNGDNNNNTNALNIAHIKRLCSVFKQKKWCNKIC